MNGWSSASHAARCASARAAISSSTTLPQMPICSLAARNVLISSPSRQTSQPVRMPGMPYVLLSELTLIARSLSVAATGSGSPNVISR